MDPSGDEPSGQSIGIGFDYEPAKRVAIVAAHASNAAECFVFRMVGDGYVLHEWSGDGALPIVSIADRNSSNAVALSFADGCNHGIGLWIEGLKDIQLAAAVPIGDSNTGGLLVVIDRELREPLSPAQFYVLQAHAAHLATIFALHDLQHSRIENEREQSNRAERLRLLESVAVHARDSIIITEAEPCTMPGPRILYCNAAFDA